MACDSLAFVTTPAASGAARSLGRFVERVHTSHIKRKTARARAIVKQRTIRTLGYLPRLADEEIVWRAEEAARTGWPRQHPLAYEDVESMLRDALQGTQAVSVISDVSYLAEKVMPFMREHDLSPALLIGLGGNPSAKARALVPRLRAHEKSATSETRKADLWLKELAALDDPEIKAADIRAQNHGSKHVSKIHIYETRLGQDTVELKITASVKQARYIQRRLNGKCRWHKGRKHD